jgi:hypothetical protein
MLKLAHLLSVILVAVIGQPALAEQLFGGVQHSDSLPPTNDALRAIVRRQQAPNLVPQQAMLAPEPKPLNGSVAAQAPNQPLLNGSVATLAQPAVDWFMIPQWMAGKWNKKGDMTVSVTDLLTGRTGEPNVWTDDDMTIFWGYQTDRAGNVWHANFTPNERDGHSDGELVRFVAVAQKCEGVSPEHLLTRTHYVITETYGNTNEVADRFQQETLAEFVPVSGAEFSGQSSNKMFHMNGQAYRVGVLQSKYNRLAEFTPINFERGLDMRRALADYLHTHGMDNLIPDTPPSAAVPN